MKEEKENGLEEAKELFNEGLKNIFKATKKVTEKIVEGFREGYAEDVTKKNKNHKFQIPNSNHQMTETIPLRS
jgi:hypothetical protein